MGLYSQDNAKKVLNRLVERPSVTGAAKLLGASSKLIWIWCRNSARDKANGVLDSKYIIHGWPDDDPDSVEDIWFHDAVELSRKMHALNADADTRELLAGQPRTVIEGGRICFTPDPKIAAHALEMDDDLWELTYGSRPRADIFARDENGALIPLEVRDPVPAQLKIHAMKVLMPNLWNVPEKREIDKRSQSSVLVLHGDVQRPNKADSPLRADLETRLKAIRDNPDRPTARPTAPVEILGRATGDPPEKISMPSNEGERTLADHPRAYLAPKPEPVRRPPPSYARPAHHLDNAGRGAGVPPPGGFRVVK